MLVLFIAVGAFVALAFAPWNPDPQIRRAAALVSGVLILWIAEVAPLGVIALLIPIAATFSGLLTWKNALASWSDEIVFLFLGTFLLARALEKHGVLDRLVGWTERRSGLGRRPARLMLTVLFGSGLVSTVQNNTAVTAVFLPGVLPLARRSFAPATVLFALSFGATFGGMATPVGTAPNFLGFAEMQRLDPEFSFLGWMRVGVPVWIGLSLIAFAVLWIAGRLVRPASDLATRGADSLVQRTERAGSDGSAEEHEYATQPAQVSPDDRDSEQSSHAPRSGAARWAVGAFACTALVWLTVGALISLYPGNAALQDRIRTYVPDSLPPIAFSALLFFIRVGPARKPILERRDLKSIDWDTLFLIAGGLCLGKVLDSSGAATALAGGVAGTNWSPPVLLAALAVVTVLLSELTSNTATAALMIPIAASLATQIGTPPVPTVWLVALSASLGFAMPFSTPPNAIVYGTGMIRLRFMVVIGLIVDLLAVAWVIVCMRIFA